MSDQWDLCYLQSIMASDVKGFQVCAEKYNDAALAEWNRKT